MAGYSENREYNLEIKYLRKVLGEVATPLPDSLRGDVLLRQLDGIPAPVPQESKVSFIFPKGWLSLRSGLTYAAAFLLMVTLFYSMGMHNRDGMVMGEIPIARQTGEVTSTPERAEGTPILLIGEADAGIAEDAVTESQPQSRVDIIAPATDSADTPAMDSPEPVTFGVGGNPSVVLGDMGNYVLAFRAVDGDPERMEASTFVLELWDADANNLISQTDIPEMTEVREYYAEGDNVALVGLCPDGAMTFWATFAQPEEPVGQVIAVQPGRIVDAGTHDGVLRVVSYTGTDEEEYPDSFEIVEMPDSTDSGLCAITAVDLLSGEAWRKIFTGAGADIKLYKLSAYIAFQQGTGQDGALRYAKIALDGTGIELSEIS